MFLSTAIIFLLAGPHDMYTQIKSPPTPPLFTNTK